MPFHIEHVTKTLKIMLKYENLYVFSSIYVKVGQFLCHFFQSIKNKILAVAITTKSRGKKINIENGFFVAEKTQIS